MLLAASDAGHFARDGCQKRRPTTFDAANGTGTETSSSRGLRMWERLRVNTSFGREPDMPCIHCHPSRARNRQAARRFHRLGGGRRPPARFSSLRGSGGARSRRLAATLRLGDGVAKRWRIRDTPLAWQTCLNRVRRTEYFSGKRKPEETHAQTPASPSSPRRAVIGLRRS